MRAVMVDVPRSFLEARRKAGLDRWDEVWEGELHMVPPPHGGHGRLNDQLGIFFGLHWEELGLGRTYVETGVKRPGAPPFSELGEDVPSDYRTPDRSFLLPPRYDRVVGGWIVGGPDVALEVESPGDETRKKLPFYAAVGVRELIIIGRESRQVEVLRSDGATFEAVAPTTDGWVTSAILRTQFRTEPQGLRIRRSDELARERLILG
jgi:Uma2 family endonuclease